MRALFVGGPLDGQRLEVGPFMYLDEEGQRVKEDEWDTHAYVVGNGIARYRHIDAQTCADMLAVSYGGMSTPREA